MSHYILFIDESGDHGLATPDPDFPVFLLCGSVFEKSDYEELRAELNAIKQNFWGDKKVIFHSRDIRKCEKEFQILLDLTVKQTFYKQLNAAIANGKYTIIASAIDKNKYVQHYGRLSQDVYELALSFIIERTVFYLDSQYGANKQLEIVIERRGKKEDKKLEEHFQRLMSKGTGYVTPQRIRNLNPVISFRDKKDNINGLQLADLLAYPTARYVIDKERANPAFDLIAPKFYHKDGKRHGLKIFP